MDLLRPVSKRRFTVAAQAAALASKRRKRDQAPARDPPEVFVVRQTVGPLQFVWEIRRFGEVVLQTGLTAHPAMAAARSAGEVALSGPEAQRQ